MNNNRKNESTESGRDWLRIVAIVLYNIANMLEQIREEEKTPPDKRESHY